MKPFKFRMAEIHAINDDNVLIHITSSYPEPPVTNSETIPHRQVLDLIRWLEEWADPPVDPETI